MGIILFSKLTTIVSRDIPSICNFFAMVSLQKLDYHNIDGLKLLSLA